jgi:hypothetical protein
MVVLTEIERKLLERLAAIGKATLLAAQDLQIAKPLESDGLIITPKGRHVLADREMSARPAKKPFGFMD